MKKIIITALAGCMIALNVTAQTNRTHVIKAGETLSAIAPQYGTTVGDIMRLNGMTGASKLVVGQEIKIPSEGVHVASNINPEANKPATTATTTTKNLTHTVVAGESLYKIGRDNKVTVEDIRKWNNLPDNNIKVGQILALSPDVDPSKLIVSKTETTSTTTSIESTKEDNTPTVQAPPAPKGTTLKKSDTTVISTSVANGGFFSGAFSADIEGKKLTAESGNSGIFQSQAGWTNGKYYMQMNNVAPGTVVRLKANGTTIYAKVLWNLSDSKENNGLQYRISDAAAAVLGIAQDSKNFPLNIEYYK